MDGAAKAFGEKAAAFTLRKPEIAVYSNFTTEPYTENVRELMEQQINHSLRWQETMYVGVGNTLKKLIARILPESHVYSVSSMEEAEQVSKEVSAEC